MRKEYIKRDEVQAAIDNISRMFHWDKSEEGFEYWNEVRRKLYAYLEFVDGGKPDCRDEIKELRRRLAEIEAKCL